MGVLKIDHLDTMGMYDRIQPSGEKDLKLC